MDFVDVNESNARWVQDFRLKAYSSPAKLEAVDGERPGPRGLGVRFPVGVWSPAPPHSVPGAPRGMLPGADCPGSPPSCVLRPKFPSCIWGEVGLGP